MVNSTRIQEIENLKEAIREQREWGNNKVANLLAEELDSKKSKLRCLGCTKIVDNEYGLCERCEYLFAYRAKRLRLFEK